MIFSIAISNFPIEIENSTFKFVIFIISKRKLLSMGNKHTKKKLSIWHLYYQKLFRRPLSCSWFYNCLAFLINFIYIYIFFCYLKIFSCFFFMWNDFCCSNHFTHDLLGNVNNVNLIWQSMWVCFFMYLTDTSRHLFIFVCMNVAMEIFVQLIFAPNIFVWN